MKLQDLCLSFSYGGMNNLKYEKHQMSGLSFPPPSLQGTKAPIPPETKTSQEELDKRKWQEPSHCEEITQAEYVNEEVLADCDDGILERDLGIKSKIHRMQFINVIKGKVSKEPTECDGLTL